MTLESNGPDIHACCLGQLTQSLNSCSCSFCGPLTTALLSATIGDLAVVHWSASSDQKLRIMCLPSLDRI